MDNSSIIKKEQELLKLHIHGITLKVGDFIRDSRRRKKLTIAELSKIACVSSTVITDLENGRSLPRTEVLLKLALALGIRFNTLFEKFIQDEIFDLSCKKKTKVPTLEDMIKAQGLGNIDLKEVLSFIEFKKFQNKKRK